MQSAFGIEHGEDFSKEKLSTTAYWAVSQAAKNAKKGRLVRLSEHEVNGIRAGLHAKQTKARIPHYEPEKHSRPLLPAHRAAWDRGFNSAMGS